MKRIKKHNYLIVLLICELKAALRLRAAKDREKDKEKDREKDGASRNREAKDSARDTASGDRGRAPQNEPSAGPATA